MLFCNEVNIWNTLSINRFDINIVHDIKLMCWPAQIAPDSRGNDQCSNPDRKDAYFNTTLL